MLKRDPYNHEVRWQKWKQENKAGIKEISKHNSDLILAYLMDMEMGKKRCIVGLLKENDEKGL